MNKKVYVDLSQQDVQDIINAYEKDIEKFNKQKEVLDKIKEILKDPDKDGFDEDGYDDSYYDMIYTQRIYELLEEIE
jgi:hypothetical protein